MKRSIYDCPNCGKKAVNPWRKAMAGRLNSKGIPCPHCGKHITNGVAATVFNAIFSLASLIVAVLAYLSYSKYDVLIIIAAICSAQFVPRLINAFFFKMENSQRKDVLS